MNDELIYKWKLIETLKNWLDDQEHETLYGQGYDDAVKDIIGLIEYEKPIRGKTGRWKEIFAHRDDEGDILRDYECTNCLGIICDVIDDAEKDLPTYCCMCGAKMEERWSK